MERGTNTFLGPFKIDQDGRLQPASEGQVPRFTVRWPRARLPACPCTARLPQIRRQARLPACRLIQAEQAADKPHLGAWHGTSGARRSPS